MKHFYIQEQLNETINNKKKAQTITCMGFLAINQLN